LGAAHTHIGISPWNYGLGSIAAGYGRRLRQIGRTLDADRILSSCWNTIDRAAERLIVRGFSVSLGTTRCTSESIANRRRLPRLGRTLFGDAIFPPRRPLFASHAQCASWSLYCIPASARRLLRHERPPAEQRNWRTTIRPFPACSDPRSYTLRRCLSAPFPLANRSACSNGTPGRTATNSRPDHPDGRPHSLAPAASVLAAPASDGTEHEKRQTLRHTHPSYQSARARTPHQAFHSIFSRAARLAPFPNPALRPTPLLSFSSLSAGLPEPIRAHLPIRVITRKKKSRPQIKIRVPPHLSVNKLLLLSQWNPVTFPCDGSRCACRCIPQPTDFRAGQSPLGVRPKPRPTRSVTIFAGRSSGHFHGRPRCSGVDYSARPHISAPLRLCFSSFQDARHPFRHGRPSICHNRAVACPANLHRRIFILRNALPATGFHTRCLRLVSACRNPEPSTWTPGVLKRTAWNQANRNTQTQDQDGLRDDQACS